jgi:hypothetical protein
MKSNCGNPHKINYQDVCCLTIMIEMTEIAENQMRIEKYSQTVIKVLQTIHEKDNVQYEKFSIPFMMKFLEVLSKYMNLFYFSGNQIYFNKRAIYQCYFINSTCHSSCKTEKLW